jgi:hypothetical protein
VSAAVAEAGGWVETFEPSCARHTTVAAATSNNNPNHLFFIALSPEPTPTEPG